MSDLLKVAQVRRLKESACPACGNEDLFWDKTPVLARDMGHERRAWWPDHSYALDEVGESVLECASCGTQFRSTSVDPPPEDEDDDDDR